MRSALLTRLFPDAVNAIGKIGPWKETSINKDRVWNAVRRHFSQTTREYREYDHCEKG